MVRQQGAATVQQAHREEERPARNAVVAVVCHGLSVPITAECHAEWRKCEASKSGLNSDEFYTRFARDHIPFPREKLVKIDTGRRRKRRRHDASVLLPFTDNNK